MTTARIERMEQKRLFVGFPVEISASLQAALKKTKIRAQQKQMEVNWIQNSNFHVTLFFLGETDIDRIPELQQILKTVALNTPPLKTTLRGMGGFPEERHMRVMYVGVRLSRALAEFQMQLQSALKDAGFRYEDRSYQPHLTVARLRKARSGTDLLSPYVRNTFGDITVGGFVLYESVSLGSYPVYQALRGFELCGEIPQYAESV